VNGQAAARLYEYDEKEVDERPYWCKQRGCEYKAKEKEHLKIHLAHIHDIGVKWYTCPQEGCEYKAKERKSIKHNTLLIFTILA
jgi:hypothetical protein